MSESGTDLTESLAEMAARIAEAAPHGWRRCQAKVWSQNGHTAYYGGRYELVNGETRTGNGELRIDARRAHPLAKAARHLTIELAVEPSGRFEAVSSDVIARGRISSASMLIVLDHDTLPSDPGDEAEGPADPSFAGDPDEAVQLFRTYLRRRAQILGHEEELPDPLDPADRAELVATMGTGLPPDLAALYGEADGDSGDQGIICGQDWYALESVFFADDGWEAHGECRWIDDPLWNIPFDAEPLWVVRRSWKREGWIPFAVDPGGEAYLVVDMDPGPAGRPGQVILVEMGIDGPLYVADSITSLLRRHLQALDRGDYTVENGHLWINGLLPDGRQIDEDRKWNADDHGGSLRGIPPTVQRLYADDLDLETVRRTPLLRHAALGGHRCDLAPLREVPLEVLDLYLDSVDLTPLSGHPHLRAVRLSSREPVDLGVLATFPRLEGLDLSRAAVTGMDRLAELDGLSYLCLSLEQWREFQEHVGMLSSLAAVGVHGCPTPAEINEWASHFCLTTRGHRHGVQYHTGQLSGTP